jgi:hypothetical protein
MKIGPMLQNPGRVLCRIFMMGLLSQVMDNAIVNVVNVNVVNVNVVNVNVVNVNVVNVNVVNVNVVNVNVVNVNVVNVNVVKAKDSAILAGGKAQSVSSQVVEVNKINPGQVLQHQVVDDVNVDVVNENNPGQVFQNQVGDNGNMDNLEQVLLSLEDVNAVEVNIGNKDHREVGVTMDNENNPEQVPTSQVVDMINMKEVYGDVDVTLNEEDGNVVNMVNEDNPEQGLPS